MDQWKDIGETLREAREAKSLAVADVAHQTRISAHTIHCLEDNDYSHFVSPTYAKSFLAQYAEFLGLDGQEWLENFQSTSSPLPLQKKRSSQSQSPSVLLSSPNDDALLHNHKGSGRQQQPLSGSGRKRKIESLIAFVITVVIVCAVILAIKFLRPPTDDQSKAIEPTDSVNLPLPAPPREENSLPSPIKTPPPSRAIIVETNEE